MTYDPTSVTTAELLAMRRLLSRYVDKSVNLDALIRKDRRRKDQGQKTTGSQIYLRTVAHGCPSTHAQAKWNARSLADAMVGRGLLVQTDVPRVHFTTALGFVPRYHPSRFGDRTGLGNAWTWACASHGTRYGRCYEKCAQGVRLDGRFLIDVVRNSS